MNFNIPPLNAPLFGNNTVTSSMWALWLSNVMPLISVVGSAVASGTTIIPSGQVFHVTGTSAINTIQPPFAGFRGAITLIPDAIFTTGTSDNIALGSTAVVGKALIMTYDGQKWYPSY